MKLKIGPLPNPEKVKILVQISVELKESLDQYAQLHSQLSGRTSGCGDVDSVHAPVVHRSGSRISVDASVVASADRPVAQSDSDRISVAAWAASLARSARATMVRACWRKISPADVNLDPRVERSSRRTPKILFECANGAGQR